MKNSVCKGSHFPAGEASTKFHLPPTPVHCGGWCCCDDCGPGRRAFTKKKRTHLSCFYSDKAVLQVSPSPLLPALKQPNSSWACSLHHASLPSNRKLHSFIHLQVCQAKPCGQMNGHWMRKGRFSRFPKQVKDTAKTPTSHTHRLITCNKFC